MKQGLGTINELAALLQDNERAKADYMTPVSNLWMANDASLTIDGTASDLVVRPTGHNQIAEYTSIPLPYYNRMLANEPTLLASNVNRWLEEKEKDRRMVRTLNGEVRALLSDRYKRIDNLEVAEVALKVLADVPELRVVSCQVTESRMYIKAVSAKITAPDPGLRRVGSLIEAGVIITNSEIGHGAVGIKPFANFLACLNGMIRDDGKMRANHVGTKADEEIQGLLADDTRRLEDEVVLRKVRDVIRNAFDELAFRRFIDRLTQTTQERIEGDVPRAVEVLGKALTLSGGEKSSILTHLIEGGDLSRYGLANAVTRTAEDVESYDRATEIESLGYKVITLPATAWREISQAKPVALAA
jgi:hypothetical protein